MGPSSEVIVVGALRTELLFVPGPKAALGVGQKARARLRQLLDRRHPKGVVILGYAGGLRPDLPPGTLVLADSIVDEEGVVRVNADLLSCAKRLLPAAKVGPLFTANTLTSQKEKEVLGEKAVAVDMETSHLARELLAKGVPFLVGRAILDACLEEAPQGWHCVFWAGRALRCSHALGRAARILRPVLAEGI